MAKYDILTMEEVAKRLKVSLKTVYRWIKSGRLPASQVGYKTYRIFEIDLIKFMYRHRIKTQNSKRKR